MVTRRGRSPILRAGSGTQRLARAAAVRMLSTLAPLVSSGVRRLPFGTRVARFLLAQTWSRGNAAMLDRYLVSGYQNPRINIQSILVRHFLISTLFASEHDQLAQEEIGFAVELNEVLRRRALELGVTMGSFLDPAKHAAVQRVDRAIADREREFEHRWHAELSEETVRPLSVLEFACGSANDYRAFVSYGLARHLDYTGVDLTAKNIENALRRFPDARFEVGNILDLPYGDASFAVVIAADIFEHLAPDEMERALDEACRLARHGVVLTFFNMSGAPDHLVQRKRAYHWNRLSAPRVEEHLRRHFSTVTTTPIATWLKDRFDYSHSYNRGAYTIVAERRTPPSNPASAPSSRGSVSAAQPSPPEDPWASAPQSTQAGPSPAPRG